METRIYNYSVSKEYQDRPEYRLILSWVPESSSVIDFAAGDGSLCALLKSKNCKTYGLELSESGVASAREKGIELRQMAVDVLHPEIASHACDYAICNVSIQMVMFPEILLQEMSRIGKRQIISFPNFAHYKNRLDLLIHGRMPKPMLYGYEWFSTGHIHQLSFRDFQDLAKIHRLRVLRFTSVGNDYFGMRFLARLCPNLFAKTIVCELEKIR